MSGSADRVADALSAAGLAPEIRSFPASTRSAAEAAAAIGCPLPAIAKSLIFRTEADDSPLLVVAGGDKRVDMAKLAAAAGTDVGRAGAAYVRKVTGFAIGGVAPVGHATPPTVLLEVSLRILPEMWAAAGTPNAVFRLTPDELQRLTAGTWTDLAGG